LDLIRKQSGIITVFDQIKEKFGSGRFYYHTDNPNENMPKDVADALKKKGVWQGGKSQ
jgi:hypothetical protein